MRVAESKLNFKLRTLMNCGIVAVVFIPAVFIFAQFPGEEHVPRVGVQNDPQIARLLL
jgi:hypothetical protein